MTSASASASASAPAPAPTTPYDAALAAIDAAHALDPTLSSPTTENTTPIPYELHYARKCSAYLSQRSPSASPLLRLAIRAQHFRRWETPRSEYPATRAGYHAWRANAKKRQADLVVAICREAGFSEEESQHVGRLIKKEGLSTASSSSSSSSSSGGAAGGGDKEGDEDEEEVVVLEDVACLVFLDDQFAAFEKEHDQDKIVRILRKTWAKMSARGRDMALSMEMDGRRRDLVEKALKP